jgi:hypothetical protein
MLAPHCASFPRHLSRQLNRCWIRLRLRLHCKTAMNSRPSVLKKTLFLKLDPQPLSPINCAGLDVRGDGAPCPPNLLIPGAVLAPSAPANPRLGLLLLLRRWVVDLCEVVDPGALGCCTQQAPGPVQWWFAVPHCPNRPVYRRGVIVCLRALSAKDAMLRTPPVEVHPLSARKTKQQSRDRGHINLLPIKV